MNANRLLGARIRKARLAFPAMTSDLVAGFLQITPEQFAAFEAGRARPSSDQIVLMADLMDVAPGWFFAGLDVALKAPADRSPR